jgi:hypothetical protein
MRVPRVRTAHVEVVREAALHKWMSPVSPAAGDPHPRPASRVGAWPHQCCCRSMRPSAYAPDLVRLRPWSGSSRGSR